MIKRPIYQQNIAILNINAPKNTTVTYVKQNLIELKGEIDNSTRTAGDFNTPWSTIDSITRQKISMDKVLNTTKQQNRINLYRTLYPKREEYTFFSSVYRTYNKTDYILGHKTNLNKFKRIEIIQSVFQPKWNQTRTQ